MPALIPAVGYLRRSTDKQESSIPDQTKAVQRYADDKGYQVLRWYVDDGISGDDTDNRLDFLRMIEDAKQIGDFKAILCWDEARFGRFDSYEAGFYIHPLRKAGVCLVSTLEGVIDWNTSQGRMIGGMKQEGRHQQLLDHAANVARGHKTSAEMGSWVGSPPYGYKIEGPKKQKRLILDDPGTVRLVQRIFREFVQEGRSMNSIATRLNEEGYTTPGGFIPGTVVVEGAQKILKGWRYDAIRSILENPAYTGDFTAGKYSYGKYRTRSRGEIVNANGRCSHPEADWTIRRDHHEAIIDRETWEEAQAILAKGKTGQSVYTPDTNPYLLSGLLRCGRCGCGMSGAKKGKTLAYECSNQQYNGQAACQGATVREYELLRSIADHFDREFLSLDGVTLGWRANRQELEPGDLPEAFAKLKSMISPPKQPAADRKRMEREHRTLGEQIDKARRNLAMLSDPENIPVVEREIRRLQTERDQLDLELKKQPRSEQDINAETKQLLRSIAWMAMTFNAVAAEAIPPAKWRAWNLDGSEGIAYGLRLAQVVPIKELKADARKWLRVIAGITVHTQITGEGFGTRHHFQSGEILLKKVGVNKGNLNPQHPSV